MKDSLLRIKFVLGYFRSTICLKRSDSFGSFSFALGRGGDKGSAALNGLRPRQAARSRRQETTKMLAFRVRSL